MRRRPFARAALALGLAAAVPGPPARAEGVQVAILHTNDLHGRIDPAVRLLETIRALRARHPASILLDAGDAFESKVPGSVETGGREMVAFMNRAGYDGRAFGDNEFVDFRLEDALANVKRLAFPTLSANLRVKGVPLGLPYFVYQRGGATLAVIGVYGDHKSLARFGVEELSSKESVRELASALAGKVDCIVLLSHAGVKRERGYAKAIPGIDVIVGGSTHATLDPEVVGKTVIVRAEARGAAVGALVLEIDTDRDRVQKWSFERVPTAAAGRP
ncbi:MAG TPA: metallophosphoesterase [Myxococcota bacterium]|jgi:2',3'-cyclic-nucleotide 2'-phosphodiesterase (5'-nucleotidase family)